MAKRKTFVTDTALYEDPALSFISRDRVQESAAEIVPSSKIIPKGYRSNPACVEIKSRRVQMIMQPSLYKRIKQASEQAGLSFNEFCCRVLEQSMQNESSES